MQASPSIVSDSPTSNAQKQRFNKVARLLIWTGSAALNIDAATRLYQAASMTAAVAAMQNCSNIDASGSINWLNNARKKKAILGLESAIKMPSQPTRTYYGRAVVGTSLASFGRLRRAENPR